MNVNTRQCEKKATIGLSKKAKDAIIKYGSSALSVGYSLDHLVIKHGSETLMDIDINETNNNEYIRSINSYKWL